MKILVMGLPGSGKTTFAKQLAHHFLVPHHNADTYREFYEDWDFSHEGRMRQARRMSKQWGILDFVCPLEEMRKIVKADTIIWLDTIQQGRFEDTNKLFEKPNYDIRITSWTGVNQLLSYSEDFNPGTKGIQNFLNELMRKQDK